MGRHGATVVPENARILHHCNTGALATVDVGTALGVIYTCHEQGKNPFVWVDETRPRLQGARLTAWELMQAGVPLRLIADSAAASLMRRGKVDIVLFGADRVAANGDTVNKIGTYSVSVNAHETGVPVYAVVPTSTIDLTLSTGDEIPIEERGAQEVAKFGASLKGGGIATAPEGCDVYNPAFDCTPYKYLNGIITEEGICYPPFSKSLAAAKARAEARITKGWGTLADMKEVVNSSIRTYGKL
jgi:methylthioribose-1-phosphate isomerase